MPDHIWTICHECGLLKGVYQWCPMCGGRIHYQRTSDLYAEAEREMSPEIERERENEACG